jgi:hypothetical protein
LDSDAQAFLCKLPYVYVGQFPANLRLRQSTIRV